MEDVDFIRGRMADDEAMREFNRQRDHLEKQIASLKQQLEKSVGGSKNDIGKIMHVNYHLIMVTFPLVILSYLNIYCIFIFNEMANLWN